MRLSNLHTAPMRHLIKFRTSLKKRRFLLQNPKVCDVLKVLYLAKFSKISHRYTRQHKVPDHQLKITFQRSDFVRKALFISYKRQLPLPCQSINFIFFLFILHHKCQNNVPEPKTSYQQPLCKFESDFQFVQFFFIHSVYVYVYMYICIYVYMYICIYVYMYICIYVYMYICIYVYMYICIYVYIYRVNSKKVVLQNYQY